MHTDETILITFTLLETIGASVSRRTLYVALTALARTMRWGHGAVLLRSRDHD